ncbi:hypothetical protein B0H66DRAFT_559910 [Apodospora peruviana]|uniref:Arylamine N-acetyltransferase n=1 Tax=Apodospora peruviana TaxID=516989 RepID=A0AAE0M1K6_9PEZI|nr:hypothetical protein B0H66DRAFT_559910 [Apodospora peruviana]
MATYSEGQLNRYFIQIGSPHYNEDDWVVEDPLGVLRDLQMYHMATVTFDSLALHYSKHRTLSLDPDDLWEKVARRGRGGYCMEVNTVFAAVLRSLGYTLISVGGRVKSETGYKGWNHMVNLVTIYGKRYLVDVGFGSDGPPQPVPLEHGIIFDCVAPVRGRLEYKKLEEHTDHNQRVWVYSTKENEQAEWKDRYAFVEIEFFPADFEVMNLQTSTTPQSYFVQTVMCMKTILDDPGRKRPKRAVGVLILHKDYVKRRIGDKSEILETLKTESDRASALLRYFDINLSPEERRGIKGLASELRG